MSQNLDPRTKASGELLVRTLSSVSSASTAPFKLVMAASFVLLLLIRHIRSCSSNL